MDCCKEDFAREYLPHDCGWHVTSIAAASAVMQANAGKNNTEHGDMCRGAVFPGMFTIAPQCGFWGFAFQRLVHCNTFCVPIYCMSLKAAARSGRGACGTSTSWHTVLAI
jgi:hypothetical protein